MPKLLANINHSGPDEAPYGGPVWKVRFDPNSPAADPIVVSCATRRVVEDSEEKVRGAAHVSHPTADPNAPETVVLQAIGGHTGNYGHAHDTDVLSADFAAISNPPATLLVTGGGGRPGKPADEPTIRLWKKPGAGGGPWAHSWDLDDGANIGGPVFHVRFDKATDPKYIAAACGDGTARVFSLANLPAPPKATPRRPPKTDPDVVTVRFMPYQGPPPDPAHMRSLKSADFLQLGPAGSETHWLITIQNNGKVVLFPLDGSGHPVVLPTDANGSPIPTARAYSWSYARNASNQEFLAIAFRHSDGSRAIALYGLSNPAQPALKNLIKEPAIYVDLRGGNTVEMVASLVQNDNEGQLGYWPDVTKPTELSRTDLTVPNADPALPPRALLPARKVAFARDNVNPWLLSVTQNQVDIWAPAGAGSPLTPVLATPLTETAEVHDAEFHPKDSKVLALGSGPYDDKTNCRAAIYQLP